MTVNSNRIAEMAVDGLRREARAAEVPQADIGQVIGKSRQTVNVKFRSGDMRLTEFVNIAQSLGISPHKVLERAEKKTPRSPIRKWRDDTAH